MKVTVLDDYQRAFEGTEAIQRLRKKLDVQILTEKLPTEEALIHALKGVQAIIPVRERTKFPASLIQALTDLEFISQTGNHAYHVDMKAATNAGILVAMAPGSNSTTELAFGLMLAVMRRIPQSDQAMRQGDWPLVLGYVLRGKTLGILGLGKVGTGVAEIGRAFGMKIIAWGPTLTPERAGRSQAIYTPLDDLLKQADVVSVHLALSDQSKNLLNEARLRLMKKSAYLINTARGAIVDEKALVKILQEHGHRRSGVGCLCRGAVGGESSAIATRQRGSHPALGLANGFWFRRFCRECRDEHPRLHGRQTDARRQSRSAAKSRQTA